MPPATRTRSARRRPASGRGRRPEVVLAARRSAPRRRRGRCPSRTARRSPVEPGCNRRAQVAPRRRSAKPPTPPRRPICRQSSTWRTTCTPWRRSHVRSSNPPSGPRGCRTTREHLEDGPLRRSAPERELELDTLARAARRRSARTLAGDADVVAGLRGGAVTTTTARPARSILALQRAAVERVEALACPPPAEQTEQHARRRRAGAAGTRRRRPRPRRPGSRRCPSVCRRATFAADEADARRGSERMRRSGRPGHGSDVVSQVVDSRRPDTGDGVECRRPT